ncbi:hypothetical protein ZHAS_00011733 [Anopheles sinensis]|uniref:Uncharacterized protein n=1 Tax=Anopheles sinensis TaxID=74873 RepID=A0A084W0Z9_ANOSI|nr:hypothetical protein ZHAS_00011733 [Anopheles sinensis]
MARNRDHDTILPKGGRVTSGRASPYRTATKRKIRAPLNPHHTTTARDRHIDCSGQTHFRCPINQDGRSHGGSVLLSPRPIPSISCPESGWCSPPLVPSRAASTFSIVSSLLSDDNGVLLFFPQPSADGVLAQALNDPCKTHWHQRQSRHLSTVHRRVRSSRQVLSLLHVISFHFRAAGTGYIRAQANLNEPHGNRRRKKTQATL